MKLDDIKVFVTALGGEICIGKSNSKGIATNKKYVTQECVNSVCMHMDMTKTYEYECQVGTLKWIPKETKENDNG